MVSAYAYVRLADAKPADAKPADTRAARAMLARARVRRSRSSVVIEVRKLIGDPNWLPPRRGDPMTLTFTIDENTNHRISLFIARYGSPPDAIMFNALDRYLTENEITEDDGIKKRRRRKRPGAKRRTKVANFVQPFTFADAAD